MRRHYLFVLIYLCSVLFGFNVYAQSSDQTTEHNVEQSQKSQYQIIPEQIVKSERDHRQYQVIELDNHMKVLLISDPKAVKSIASMALPVGSLYDPASQQGLAHYLEHMMFMGSKNYPEPGSLAKYLSQHAGSFNASTAQYQTDYYFEVENSAFDQALARMADSIAHPLFDVQYADKERNAVNAELTMARSNDGFRIGQVDSETINQAHPYSQFSGGNLQTLSDKADSKLHDELLAFYHRYYSANIMAGVMYSNQSIDQLANLAATTFGQIGNRNITVAPISQPALTEQQLGKLIYMQPAQPKKVLYIQFPIDNNLANFMEKSDTYISYLINSRAEGTLFSQLQQQGLIDSLGAGSDSLRYGNSGVFSISVNLTDRGLQEKDRVISDIFAYLHMLSQKGVSVEYFDEIKNVLALDFKYPDIDWNMSYVSSLASQMLFYPVTHLLDADYLAETFNPDAIQARLKSFTPNHARIWLIAPSVTTDKVAYFVDAPYKIEDISAKQIANWKKAEPQDHFKLPPLNPYIPTDFDLVSATDNHDSSLQPFSEQGNQFHFASQYFADEPKAVITLALRNNLALDTVDHQVMAQLFNYLVSRDLALLRFQAGVAGIGLSNQINQGVVISASGFNQHLGDMVKATLATYHQVEINEQNLTLAKSWYLQQLDAADHANSYTLAMQPVNALSSIPYFEREQKRQALQQIDIKALQHYADQLLSDSVPYMISMGNVSNQQMQSLYAQVKTDLNANSRYHLMPKIEISKQQTALITQQAASTDNALYAGFFPKQQDPATDKVTSYLLYKIISPWFYDQLRTEEQLGYVVSALPTYINENAGIGFLVQSNQYDPAYLNGRYQAFYPTILTRLEQLTNDEFVQYRQSELDDMLSPPQTLDDEFGLLMGDFYRSNFKFDSRTNQIEKLKQLTHQQVVDFYRQAVIDQQGLVLDSQVLGQQTDKKAEAVTGLTAYPNAQALQEELLDK